LYYQNWHIKLTKSRNKTASATAAAASHHELCMMAMANGNQTCEEGQEQEPALFLRAFATPLATFFFYWRN
jgi:hypothetical protein